MFVWGDLVWCAVTIRWPAWGAVIATAIQRKIPTGQLRSQPPRSSSHRTYTSRSSGVVVSAQPGVQEELRDSGHANFWKRRWAKDGPELSQHDGDWPNRAVSEDALHARVGASRADQAVVDAIERVPTVTNSTAPRAPVGVRNGAHSETNMAGGGLQPKPTAPMPPAHAHSIPTRTWDPMGRSPGGTH